MVHMTADERAFQREAAEFFSDWSEGHGISGEEHSDDLYQALAARKWIGLQWPEELGGLGRGAVHSTVMFEEAGYYRAPILGASLSSMVGAALIALDPRQAARFIGPIVAGTAIFCLGYSEPEAGSDLASLQTRAIPDANDWIIRGSKVFTSLAQRATHMFLAARTSTELARHRGVSVFTLDLSSPGVTIEALPTIEGTNVAIVHLDGVRVPGRDLVLEQNQGWRVIEQALASERVGMVALRLGEIRRLMDGLITAATAAPNVDGLRADLGVALCQCEIARALVYSAARSGATSSEAAIVKLAVTGTFEQVAHLCDRYNNLVHAASGQADPYIDDVQNALIRSTRYTITGGTSEIQRNIIALRGLKLPRS